ncbi:PLP-dependent aminotransferase family protein [Bosea sp. 685]|uniref:MocR-like pyridoxine biosynthesis transcription factor PdxR n=1 Tax=Bosea sp. 685 TaxID=3080057 RepID=UPI002892AAC0|nr:PLP-dependent aminotransferase family protein [Bosea sp. 685]WNJ92957.1 PLP-dependent aminotransferase family protein [Bosea sp. 685]
MLKKPTNLPDWSALMPVLPGEGPRTRELYAAIRRLIEAGLVPAGAKLPTTRDLARRFGLSRASAVAAFEMLTADGFAEARIGAGTFVAPQVPHLPVAAVMDRGPDLEVSPPLPCALGVATLDARTLRVFRSLLARRLARPGPEHFHYGDPRGGLALRQAIASYLRSARGVRCDAEQIIVTSGSQQGLDLLIRAAIRPGDAVWIEDPCYPMAHAALANSGGHVVGVPVDSEGLDPVLGEALCPRARAVYVTPSHQFPLGITMTMRRRLALIEWARRNEAWVIEDDYDSEFRYAGPPLTALQGMDASGRVAYLGTFSKVLFPGLRVGYAVVPEPLLDAVLELRARTDRHPPSLAEGALADLLNEGHFAAHLRRSRRRVHAARDALVAGLQACRAGVLDVTVPEQGLHLVAKLTSARCDVDIVAAAKAAGVGARALSSMFVTAQPQQGLVLGFSGFADGELRAAAARLDALLQ